MAAARSRSSPVSALPFSYSSTQMILPSMITLSAKNSCTSASTFCTLAQRVLDRTLARLFLTSLSRTVRDAILRPPIYAALIEKAELHCGPTVRPASDMFLLFVGALEGPADDYPDAPVRPCETFLPTRPATEALKIVLQLQKLCNTSRFLWSFAWTASKIQGHSPLNQLRRKTTPREVDVVNALKREKRRVSSILDPRPSVPLHTTFDSC
ncbi:hypothetical protein DFH08DRAFT_1084907 [Mycena albidolilacea]|uniref:Uncharacterized protein n=1 Tax=Mycena albidolilacea TaxID=1033008 RepID=A0AAD6ZJS9_9AGAR|nr:hypothetical protein DFH08DRAFT_1084907 [Mycena albidolilacea]